MSAKSTLRLVALMCLLGLVAGVWSHASAVTAVSVTPIEPLDDIKDALGTAPYFRVDVLVDGSWKKLSPHADRPMGEGQRWVLSEPAPFRGVETLRLLEDDIAGDDFIDEADLEGRHAQGKRVTFEIEVSRDFGVGIAWFVMTPLGLILVGAIALGLFFSFLLGGGELLDLAG